jgi:hypothetical protein
MRITISDPLQRQRQRRMPASSQPYGPLHDRSFFRKTREPRGGLLVSIRTSRESYPDTGESGETYDAEQLCYDNARINRKST